MEVAKVAQRIGLSPTCGTHYTLFCSLARVRVEPVKRYSPRTTKNAVWVACRQSRNYTIYRTTLDGLVDGEPNGTNRMIALAYYCFC